MPCPGPLPFSDLSNHVCDLGFSLTQVFVFLSRYVMFNILLSICVCAANSLFFAWVVSTHVAILFLLQVAGPDQNNPAEPPVPLTDVELNTTKQDRTDSLGQTNDNQSVTSSPCYVNLVPADDKEKCPVTELNQQLKEGVERYTALQRNVLSLLHIIMVTDLNILKVSSIDKFVTQLINTSQGGEEQNVQIVLLVLSSVITSIHSGSLKYGPSYFANNL